MGASFVGIVWGGLALEAAFVRRRGLFNLTVAYEDPFEPNP